MKKYLFPLCLVLLILACGMQTPITIPTVTPTQTVTPTATPTPLPVRVVATVKPEKCAEVRAGSLHVRYAPEYHSNVMGWFTHEDTLKVIYETNSAWWLVHGDGIDFMGRQTRMTGYVKVSWIEVVNCDQGIQMVYANRKR